MARPPSNRPTDTELAILNVLWRQGPSTVRQVLEALPDAKTGYTTVLKMLQIMAEKGLVACDKSSRTHVYRAGEPQGQVQRGLVKDLLDRVFEGSASQLVQQALTSKPTSAEELAEIRKLLDDLEKDGEPSS